MKEVYYKGKPYQYQVIRVNGKKLFHLFEDNVLKHQVEESELDVRTIVTFILDAYYKNIKTESTSAAVGLDA